MSTDASIELHDAGISTARVSAALGLPLNESSGGPVGFLPGGWFTVDQETPGEALIIVEADPPDKSGALELARGLYRTLEANTDWGLVLWDFASTRHAERRL